MRTGIGDTLRAARRAQGLTLADAAEATRVRETYLAALEEGDFAALGGDVYARGFLRSYARYLELDPEPLIAAYRAQGAEGERAGRGRAPRRRAPAGRRPPPQGRQPGPGRGGTQTDGPPQERPPGAAVLLLLVVVVLLVVGFVGLRGADAATPGAALTGVPVATGGTW